MNARFADPREGTPVEDGPLGTPVPDLGAGPPAPAPRSAVRPSTVAPSTVAPSIADPRDRSARARAAAARERSWPPCGAEPPLDPAGDDAPIARRGVNWRWLAGGILTGATGAALIGTAIVVAIEGSTALTTPPERITDALVEAVDRAPSTTAKGDLLVRTALTVTATSTFEAPMAHRVGDREMIRAQSFTRIATGLSRTTGVHASDIPRFDPMRYLADDGEEAEAARIAQVELEPEDADVTVQRRPLADVQPDPLSATLSRALSPAASPALSDADALAQVREERRIQSAAGQRRAIPLPAQAMLGRTVSRAASLPGLSAYAAVDDTPFDSIEVRVIPENVSTLPKRDAAGDDEALEELGLALGREQTLPALLAEQGIAAEDIAGAVAALGGAETVAALPAGQSLRILLAPAERPGDPRRLLRVVLFGEDGVEAIAAVDDDHSFVAVAVPRQAQEPEAAVASAEEQGGARLYESLFETGVKHGLDQATIEELIAVFAYDLDFQRRVQAGDAIDLFFTRPEPDAPIEILSAALTLGGETSRVYRFRSPEDGAIDYFDPDGRSLKKFLMRKPLAEGRLTSGFGMRRHPILKYARQHTGVDWANRVGTPIFAAGAGTVTVAGWEGGYGRRVEIQHANGYLTTYSHMSRIGAGIEPGVRVTQGQVIGLLGNSGLSTGPHLHYEVKVNGRFVDPLKIRVPRSRELDGRALADFTRQRDQIDGLMERAGGPARLAATTRD